MKITKQQLRDIEFTLKDFGEMEDELVDNIITILRDYVDDPLDFSGASEDVDR